MASPELQLREEPLPTSTAIQVVEKMEGGGWKATTVDPREQDCIGCDFTLLQSENPDNQRHMLTLHRLGIG